MRRQERLRNEAKRQRLQEQNLIEHLARNLVAGGGRGPTRPFEAGKERFLYNQIRRQWSSNDGGLPVF